VGALRRGALVSGPPDRLTIVAMVGTKGPFDRLLEALAGYRARHPDASIWVQHGPGSLPEGLMGAPLIRREELIARMDEADVVVTHAGSGSVRDALTLGHRPVVVPRLERHGEHVNDHQLELVEALGDRIEGLVDLARLDEAVARAATARGAARSDGGAALKAAVRAELEAAAPHRPSLRRRLVWGLLRATTSWVPRRAHRWE